MIILHDEQLIFIKPKKVAGTSFEIALSKFATDKDIITKLSPEDEIKRELLSGRRSQNCEWNFPDPKLLRRPKAVAKSLLCIKPNTKYYNHMGLEEIKSLATKEVWSNFKKLSIIRDPFDVIASQYQFRLLKGRIKSMSLMDFVESNPSVLHLNREHYFVDGRISIDVMLRFENLIEDITLHGPAILSGYRQIALDLKKIHAKRSGTSNYKEKYKDEWEELAPILADENRQLIELYYPQYLSRCQ